jgi:hypothetical protein
VSPRIVGRRSGRGVAGMNGAICGRFAWDRRACRGFCSVVQFGGRVPGERRPDDSGDQQNPEKPISELHFSTSVLNFSFQLDFFC